MRAPISIIIPTLNAAGDLPDCLTALSEGLATGLIRELILSDGGSSDATAEIANAAGAVFLSGPASRGGQLRRGADAAQGRWLLFLHADTVLAPGWPAAVSAAMARPGAYYFRLRFDAPGLAPGLVAGWANLRSRALGLPYGDQALLVDRETYKNSGGYKGIPLMEDVALARGLRGQLTGLTHTAQTSSQKFRTQGWVRRGARNLTLLARFFLGADPEDLARAYRK